MTTLPPLDSFPNVINRSITRPQSSISTLSLRSVRQVDSNITVPNISTSMRRAETFGRSAASSNFTPASGSRSGRRSSVCGFLPLPPISASPICTPTTSSRDPNVTSDSQNTEGRPGRYSTVLHTSPDRVNLTPPTWIATPPTPPKLVRRSVTCLAIRSSSCLIAPSASFPASMCTHVSSTPSLKRRATVPAMSSRLITSFAYMPDRPVLVPVKRDFVFAASPLCTTAIGAARDVSPTFPPVGKFRPVFRISHDVNSDNEDGTPHFVESPVAEDETSAESSSNGHSASDKWAKDKQKDNVRKYHALMELLTTEVGYLMDLRALVTIYLRNLPTLSFASSTSRAASSFATPVRLNSSTHLHSTAFPFALTEFSAPQVPVSTLKPNPRYLFSDVEIEILTRNAEDLLQLHEHFVEELRIVMSDLGFHMAFDGTDVVPQGNEMQALLGRIDAAVSAVSTKFATEASRFNNYQVFCTGHPEALDLVRKVQQQNTTTWDAFEQRCSALIYDMFEGHKAVDHSVQLANNSTPAAKEEEVPRSRTRSLSSMEGTVRSLRLRTTTGPAAFFPADLAAKAKERGSHRLSFMDYMIKPIQRICKYPLLLDQLRTDKSLKRSQSTRALAPTFHPIICPEVNVIVESAAQAMKHVASLVDEARHRQDVALQSSLIVSRISTAGTTAQPSSVHPGLNLLTPDFLSSLGTCLLAGSLDVMHYKPSGNIGNLKAKYLGAFLYLGGFFVLVKVSKSKIYEPKHWFSLSSFDINDVEEEDAMLPCSFRLTCKDHQFELAAACQREKDAWLSAIRESLKHTPSWTNEPTSSLFIDGKGDLIPPSLDDGLPETVNTLPTIESIPEFGNQVDPPQTAEPHLSTIFNENVKSLKQDLPSAPPSRRSSTTSVKGIFSPMTSESDTIVIRRSSPTARSQVDQGLQDVISEPCLTARSYATSREEELFQAPRITRSGFTRSNSGLSMAGAMGVAAKNRLSRHESVRVSLRKSMLEGYDGIHTSSKKSPSGTKGVKSMAIRKNVKKLSISPAQEEDKPQSLLGSDHSLDCPTPFSVCSSATTSNPNSSTGSPVLGLHSLPTSAYGTDITGHQSDIRRTKRTRSMVDNVKHLFSSRPTLSPSSDISVSRHLAVTNEGYSNKPLSTGIFKRWIKPPLHRRVHSAPDVPNDKGFRPPISLNDSETSAQDKRTDRDFGVTLYQDVPNSYTLSTSPAREPSILSTSTFRRHLKSRETEPTLSSTNANLTILQRFTGINNAS